MPVPYIEVNVSKAILLVSCRDQKGITAGISRFVYAGGGNIESADQHIDSQSNTFFMRIQWNLKGFSIARADIAERFYPLAEKFKMKWSLYFTAENPRVAIFTSLTTHCLYDLLLKFKDNYLAGEVPLIVSNHRQGETIAKSFGIKFFYSPKAGANKPSREKKEISLLKKENIELIVLARYGQILSKDFVQRFPERIINIHHSFLPAFAGADPYGQAYTKGVKIIGATSHYVTEELDQGPIIEQATVRVSHRNSLEGLKREGRDLERIVLSRAVRCHLERKILVYNNKTVVFD